MLSSLLLLGFTLGMPAPRPDLLVTARWLADHLNDPKVVILHVGHERKDYDQGHVPGARFVSSMVLFDDRDPGVEIPTAERLDSLFESLGISDDSRVILYGDAWIMPRAFLDLDYVGHGDQTALLDGGLGAWTASGRSLSTEAPAIKRGSFTPRVRPDIVVDAAWIRSHANDPNVLLLDGRSRPEFDGPGSRERLPRHGHLPGAVFFPWNATYTDSAAALKGNSSPFIDAAKLEQLFVAAGASEGKQIVTYCTVGLRASHLYFIARLLGYSPKIYDGSMADYAPRTELPLVTAPAPPAPKGFGMLVTPEWLAEHANDPNVVILHAERNRAGYDTAHVEGSRFVGTGEFTVTRDNLPTELPTPAAAESLFERLGISDDSHIVLTGDILPAARLFFTLDYFGMGSRVAVLDGGLSAWRAAGKPVTREAPPAASRGRWTPKPQEDAVVDAAGVLEHIRHGMAILDARKADEYAGTTPEDGVARAGHIPTARNLDWTLTMRDGRFKPAAEIRRLLADQGVNPGDFFLTYCRVGTRASVLYFVGKMLGYTPVMYDGSMVDWSARAELPVVAGTSPGK